MFSSHEKDLPVSTTISLIIVMNKIRNKSDILYSDPLLVDKSFAMFEFIVSGCVICVVGTIGFFANLFGVLLSCWRSSHHSFNRSDHVVPSPSV